MTAHNIRKVQVYTSDKRNSERKSIGWEIQVWSNLLGKFISMGLRRTEEGADKLFEKISAGMKK